MERFWSLGTNFISSHSLAGYLTYNTKNRPVYGWARRHKDDPDFARELAVALYDAVPGSEMREKAVSLLLWAGADPHLRVPSLRWASLEEDEESWGTAIEAAVTWGRGVYLAKMKVDPARDNIDELWPSVRDVAALDALAAIKTPTDWSPVIRRILSHLAFDLWKPHRLRRAVLPRPDRRPLRRASHVTAAGRRRVAPTRAPEAQGRDGLRLDHSVAS